MVRNGLSEGDWGRAFQCGWLFWWQAYSAARRDVLWDLMLLVRLMRLVAAHCSLFKLPYPYVPVLMI